MGELYRFIKPHVIKHRLNLIIFLFSCVIFSIISMCFPFLNGRFIDSIILKPKINIVLSFVELYVLINFINLIIGYVKSKLFVKLQSEIGFEITSKVILHIQKSSIAKIQKENSVYLSNRISTDSMTLINFLLELLEKTIINVGVLLFAVIILFNLYRNLILLSALILPIFYLIYILLRKRIYKENGVLRDVQAKFSMDLQKQLHDFKFIKLHGVLEYYIKDLRSSFFRSYSQVMKYFKLTYCFSALNDIVFAIVQVILILLIGKKIIQGEMTIGNYTIISSYFLTMIGSIKYFFNLGQSIQEVKVAFSRLLFFINSEIENEGEVLLESIDTISFNIESIIYEKTQIPIGIQKTIRKGKLYGLTGKNGAGKSSLCETLVGMCAGKYVGEILINDYKISDLNMYRIRERLISFVEQNPCLIEGSLEKNVTMNNPNLDENTLKSLLSLFHVEELSMDYKDDINENNNNLSGGEKQKIAIIRELLKNGEMIILDEPTLSLDKTSVLNLLKYIKEKFVDKIIIIISHDESVLGMCDELIEITNANHEKGITSTKVAIE